MVNVPITQTILGDISNILGRLDKTTAVECIKRRKKIIRANTNELMSPSTLSRAKRTSEKDSSGLPSKKRAVSLYDQATLSTMMEAVKQPANNNEYLMLELSGAWEPPDRARA